MRKRYLGSFVLPLLALAVLTSCGGGDSKADGVAEFATVVATASGPGGPLDSDVATWVIASTGAAAPVACVAGTVPTTAPDSVDYTFNSARYSAPGSTSTITPSSLVITRITLTFTPANTFSPALPPIFQTQFLSAAQPVILPDSSLVLPLRIVSNELKEFFLMGLGSQSIDCDNRATYSYRAVVSFEAVEVNTNRVSTITAPGFLLVNFSDFIDG
ncbi:MAG: hypothetical protein A2075_06795 [Geobacteraceae bacterium GWC2_58_44]|nr:MAG: hypothetical protein A2075_06795 [Geobacteraceae bacterium GWC2_58_44]HBG08262.1 hypothetical protein [Geobacter sp.]